MSDAREAILKRIVAAGASAKQAATLEYRRSGTLAAAERTALFCRRISEYHADVKRIDESGLPMLISSVCRECNARRLVVPPGLSLGWRSADLRFVEDHGLSTSELGSVDGALTGCTAAIAESGTIVLTASPIEGRRALTLVPDLHVCIVQESQIVELLPEALAKVAADRLERQPITFISGPSATSDIELSRVEGVHGPRKLVVLVVKKLQ